jgi:hypothetical protein
MATIIPRFYLPNVKNNTPEFGLDHPQDTYRQIFHCKTTTLTIITREVQAPDISVTFLELSFLNTPEEYYEPIFREEPQLGDRQTLLDCDDEFSVIWTQRNSESEARITIRYLPQYSTAHSIHHKWLWGHENLLHAHLNACTHTLHTLRHPSIEI